MPIRLVRYTDDTPGSVSHTLVKFDDAGREARARAFRLIVTHWADFDTHWSELRRVVEADPEELLGTINALSEIAAVLVVALQGEWEDDGTPFDRLDTIDIVEGVINRWRPEGA